MNIKVHAVHFHADESLIEFVQEKLEKLSRFYDHIVDGEVYLRLDNHNGEENKITEIKINTPGKVLFAKEQCRTFEEATDVAVEALRKQLTKHKEKEKRL